MEQQQTTPKSARLKIIIIILAVLLVLSAGGLAARYIYLAYFAPTQSTATVPDNLIGEDSSRPEDNNASSDGSTTSSDSAASDSGSGQTAGTDANSSDSGGHAAEDKPQAPKLELYEGKPGDNQKFEVSNLFPGDSVTKYFCIKAHHDKDIDLFFKTDITEQTKNLGNVLHIKVSHPETGKVLCDAPFAEVNEKEFSELLKANSEKATTAYYQIDVSLDTSVGNEYQAALLKADFEWYVKDEGGLTPPQTGDRFPIVMWITLACSSLLLILLLLFGKRRKEARHE